MSQVSTGSQHGGRRSLDDGDAEEEAGLIPGLESGGGRVLPARRWRRDLGDGGAVARGLHVGGREGEEGACLL